MKQNPVLFFDGECAFCSFWVRTVLRWEKSPELLFCSSTSKNLKSFLTEEQIRKLQHTVLLKKEGRFSEKSTAALEVLQQFRWFWPFGHLGLLFPLALRDFVYDAIALRRHYFMQGQCALPDEHRFL